MATRFQLAENVRHRFCGPVEIRWVDPDGIVCSIPGDSVDVSVYGLGLVMPVHIPVDTEVTVLLRDVEVCGSAKVRHSQPGPSGFKMGLQFGQALVMQQIPGLDEVLIQSFYSAGTTTDTTRTSIIQRLRAWRGLQLQ